MHAEAGAALLFLILYTMLMCWMLFMFHTRRYLWSSRWVVLLLHAMIRVIASGLMIGFAYKGWRNRSLALAAQIMSAEGYFGIAIACYYCLRHFDHVHFGKSVLGYRGSSPEWTGRRGLRRLGEVLALVPMFLPWRYLREQLSIIESWLLCANVLIIVGAALLGVASANPLALLHPSFQYKLRLIKGLRGTGQAMLVLFSLMLCGYVAIAAVKMRRKRSWAHHQKRGMAGATLALYGIVGILMIPRSCWGLVQAVVWKYMLVNPANFTREGTQPRFLAIDYCLSTVPELLSSIALNASWWTWHAECAPHSPGVPSDEISFADAHANGNGNSHIDGGANGSFHPDNSVVHTEKTAQPMSYGQSPMMKPAAV